MEFNLSTVFSACLSGCLLGASYMLFVTGVPSIGVALLIIGFGLLAIALKSGGTPPNAAA